ncbi:MAG TPA: NAD(P)H-dependent oxidoreductase subunit E [Acidobacteriota bacterium]|nr:NAD(P)H-dependent oxidoreductase subunit E [Acidobacteriota bacterium]
MHNPMVVWEDDVDRGKQSSPQDRPAQPVVRDGREVILAMVEKHASAEDGLISILEDIQARYGYLPAGALRIVADRTNRSLVDIYGVATFYRSFSLKPRGEHLCSVCVGTACHVRGAPRVAGEVAQRLGIRPGETTSDREYTLETVNCLGACALGPIVVIDGHYFANVNTGKVERILREGSGELDNVVIERDQRIFPVEVSCPRCNHSLMDAGHPVDGYPSIRVTMSFGREHGWLRLSCLYGSYNVESEYEIPMDAFVNFFCPYCHAELLGATSCPECTTLMVPMIVRGGGVIQICSRRGGKGHMLDLNGVHF